MRLLRVLRRRILLVPGLLLGLALLAGAGAGAQQATSRKAGIELAREHAAHLRRGINASMWFAQSPGDYSAARTNRYMDDGDYQLMARLGFDHVRLPIDPEPLTRSPRDADGLNAEFLGRVDRAVDGMLAAHLAVIIDVHPEEPYKFRLRQGTGGGGADVDRFEAMWAALAAHFAGRYTGPTAGMIFFEVMNEPEVEDDLRWEGIEARTIAVIRKAAPENTIVAVGAHWDSLPDLLRVTPFADGNVIYNFHFYDPHEFTHQGATWGEGWWRYTHNVPYPASAADAAAMGRVLAQVPDAADRLEMEDYFLDDWNARHIRLLMDAAAAWGRANGVPLICDEFGVFRDHSDPAARAAWLRDVRTALEADGIGWTMWDYRSNFGVVTKQDGEAAMPDAVVVKALGLNPRQ